METDVRKEVWAKFNAAKAQKKETAKRIIERMKSKHYAETGVVLADSDFEVW